MQTELKPAVSCHLTAKNCKGSFVGKANWPRAGLFHQASLMDAQSRSNPWLITALMNGGYYVRAS